MTTGESIKVTVADGVSVMQFDRPDKKNAITLAMYDALAAAIAAAERDPAVRVHVLTGTPGAFTAGNDLKDFLAVASGGEHSESALDFLRALATTAKPVVAGVDGLAVGIGTTLLLHCDLVYASARSVFSTPFLDLGVVPEAASSLIAPRVLGPQRAFELLVLGETFSAQRAVAAGFVNGVVGEDEVQATVMAAAHRLAAKPPEALAIARRLLRGDPAEVVARIEQERAHFAQCLKSAETRKALEAFFAPV